MQCRTARQKGAAGGRVLLLPGSRESPWKGAEAVNPERSGWAATVKPRQFWDPNGLKKQPAAAARERFDQEGPEGKKQHWASHPNQRVGDGEEQGGLNQRER